MNEMLRKTREWLNCSTRRSFSAVLHEAKITPRQMQVCELKMHCPKLYWNTMYKMHCAVYGPHFDEHLAKQAVARMKNVDGSSGEHWTYEQTSQLADQQGITQKADWYYVMNMLYSDYSEIYGSDINMYIRVAKAYMRDPDAPESKVFDLWLAQMEA